jgi:hypothetical protein
MTFGKLPAQLAVCRGGFDVEFGFAADGLFLGGTAGGRKAEIRKQKVESRKGDFV